MFIYRAAVGGIAALMKVIPYSGKYSERNSLEISEMLYTPKIYFRKTFMVLLATNDYSNSEHR